MFRPVALFIGLRYTRAKRRNHFISFISLMSMFGIALGILVLITVLSVMNGFDSEIKKRVFSMIPPVTVNSVGKGILHWREAEKIIQQFPSVLDVAPFISGQIMLTHSGLVQPANLIGILPDREKKISALGMSMLQGHLTDLIPNQFGIILGEELANRLSVLVGDKITVLTPQVSLSLAGMVPRFKRFTVVGIFHIGSGFGFDSAYAFTHLIDAQVLFNLGKLVSGLHVTIRDPYIAPAISQPLADALGYPARVVNWTDQFGEYFHMVKQEKVMMFFILMLIILVAVFNLVSSLVMVVSEKEADIAILRTLGATPTMIMAIFIIQGAIIGIMGSLLGVVGGVGLALHVTEVVHFIEQIFHVQFISSSVYFLDYLPSLLEWGDVWRIGLTALSLSLLATLYPAWRAGKTQPIEALRYE